MKRFFFIGLSLFVFISCSNKKQKREFFEYHGFGGGATFIIEYDKSAGNLDAEFIKIFKEMEASVVTSNPTSLINRVNRNDSIGSIDPHFKKLLGLSVSYYKETNKYFDPTAISLDNYWNSDLNKFRNQQLQDSSSVDSIKSVTGMENIFLSGSGSVVKRFSNTKLDFKNIYLGYMVDLISTVLNSYNVLNYKIEIGGRIKARGTNKFGKAWEIGIDEPTDNVKQRKLVALAKLDNEAVVTSGDHRVFYQSNGMRFPFVVDPHTGYPVKHTLISATVISPDCVDADAYSSAFMVMGTERAKVFIGAHPQLKVYLISTNYKGEWVTWMSESLKEKVEMIKEENPI